MKNLLWGLFAFAALAHAQGTVTDIDGNTYDYLTYGTEQWTVENAAMETYRDGTTIPQVTDAAQWTNLTTGAWCYYDNDPSKGKLYNWYAVAGIHDNDPNTPNKEFAPAGWHVPTDNEWTTLEEHLIANGYNYDGTTTGNKIAKSVASTSGWLNSTNAGAPGNNQSLNNNSNFNILPHGYRNLNGIFYEESYDGILWSSTVDDPTHSWNRIIYSDQNSIVRNNGYSKSGSSVRFVQNSNTCSEVSINALSTEVCAGESVDLSIDVIGSNFSNWATGEPNNLALGTEHFGLFLSTGRWNDGPDSYTSANCIVESETNLGIVNNFTYLGVFDNHHYYLYDLTDGWNNCNNLANSLGGYLAIINSQLETNFIFNNLPSSFDRGWIGMYQDTNHPDYSEPGGAWFWVDGTPVAMSSNPSDFTWSTGDTTETISVTPSETTEYWVDVTTNDVTCREYVTINVTAPPAPTGDAEQTFCDAATVSDLSATGDNIQWYDAATGGNLLDTTSALTDGQMVYASQTVNGCESTDRLEVTVSIQDITITASATEVCAGESVDLAVSSGLIACTSTELKPNLQTGLVGYWPFCGNANDESGNGNNGTVTGAILTTDRFGNANSAYNFGQNIQDYIILPPSNNYENDNISFSFWINPSQIGQTQGWNTIIKKGDFISAESEAFIFDLKPSTNGYDKFEVGYKTACEPAGDGWQKNQYDLNENLLNNWTNFVVTLDSSNNQTIYKNGALISQTLIDGNYNSCTGAEISIGSEWGQGQPLYEFYGSIDDIAIWDRVLSESEIQQLANSPTYDWSTGDTTENITVTPTETTEYWVDVTTNGVTCREYVTITVNDLPEAPTGETVNYFINCDSFSPTLDDAIATLTGDNIKLYDAAVGGNLLDPNSNIIDGQVVYASQTLDSCESSDRLEVQLNLYTLEMPVTDAPDNTVSFCNEQNLTILDLAPAQTATDRLWYETATSTTPIAETTPLVDGVTYYVSNHDIETGCESDRLAMTVEINNPEAPTGDAVQSFCDNVFVSDLLATGSNIQWYDAATGGNLLDPSSALSDGQLLYASQTENSCESITRLEVSVEIDIIPDPILITTELEFCLAREATLSDLEVDEQGFVLEWYDSFSGGNMLPMDTLLEDGVSYYATLYDAVSGCESLMRLEVVPTVIPCEVVIYNAISLNDNGVNDYMVIENAEYFPDNSLEVYNRDGHLLYSQTQYGIGDNFFRGIANVSGIYGSTLSGDGPRLPTGSYLYVFKYFNPYEQQQYTLKGFLTINSN